MQVGSATVRSVPSAVLFPDRSTRCGARATPPRWPRRAAAGARGPRRRSPRHRTRPPGDAGSLRGARRRRRDRPHARRVRSRRARRPQLSRVHTLFDSRPDAIGASICIGDAPHTVVGVMPERFWFSSMDFPIWTTLDPAAARAESGLEVVVRRGRGETPPQLAERLQRGLAEYAADCRLRSGSTPQGIRLRRHARRQQHADRPAVAPEHRGAADAAHRLRQRRDPRHRAVDGARAGDSRSAPRSAPAGAASCAR